jgi:hypothetical protein
MRELTQAAQNKGSCCWRQRIGANHIPIPKLQQPCIPGLVFIVSWEHIRVAKATI